MLSIPDMALLGAAALLLFGPEQLPRVARRAGNVMREIQNTSSSFIREMERAADLADAPRPSVYEPVAPYEPPAPDPAPFEVLPEPLPHEPPANGALPPEHGLPPGHGLSPEHGLSLAPVESGAALDRPQDESLRAAQPAPEPDHSPHV